MVDSLLRNPERKFTYVEMAFFFRWWRQQSETRKNAVRALVNEGEQVFKVSVHLIQNIF